MPVRLATHDDIDAIAATGAVFISRTWYGRFVNPSADDLRNALKIILQHGCIWVAEIDGVVCGFLAAVLQPIWFSPQDRIALEAAWWMDEAHRGRPEGVRLVLEFERWAKGQQVHAISMSDISIEGQTSAEAILSRLGYSVTERFWTKGTR